MKLIVDEMHPSVYQTVIRNKNTTVEAVRPHIYRHLWPVGSIRAVIQDTNGALIATGDWVTIADIGAEDYFHGYVRLYVTAYLQKNINYQIKIEAGDGYSFNETAWVGLCNGFDLGRYAATYEANHYTAPSDIEIWERKA